MYHTGEGIEQNYNRASELYKKAADLGNPNAMNNLGCMCYDGRGVEQNEKKAHELYIKAICLNNITAMNNMINEKNISIDNENKILNINIKHNDLYKLQSKIIDNRLNSANNIEKDIEYISILMNICTTYDKIKIKNNIYENKKIKKPLKIIIHHKLLEIMQKEESMQLIPNDILRLITLFYI